MKFLLRFTFASALLLIITSGYSQQLAYTDAGMAWNKLMLDKQGGTYQQIGNFKVQGSAYLFGEQLKGDVYGHNMKGNDVAFKVDNYRQNLEITTATSGQFMIKPVAEIDSFVLKADANTFFTQDLHFVSSRTIDSNQKPAFLQVVYRAPGYSLYKAYTTSLGVVSTNYIQSDLRQFDLNADYYYTSPNSPGLKKLKATKAGVRKEFNNVHAREVLDESNFATNPEKVMIEVFQKLNFNS
jgi:hypothetical protein